VNTPEAQLAAAKAEIEVLKAQLSELNDKYLRTLAEQVNFRKRVVKKRRISAICGLYALVGSHPCAR